MFVRTAGDRDLAAVRALLVETWHATYDDIHGAERVTEITNEWHSIASLMARLVKPSSEFLVADDGKRIGGMAFAEAVDGGGVVMLRQLYVLPSLQGRGIGGVVMLRQLYVLPSLQGRGIGGMLLDEIIESFPEAHRIRLEVEEKNARAV